MAEKSTRKDVKKPKRSVKEKRAAKRQKEAAPLVPTIKQNPR